MTINVGYIVSKFLRIINRPALRNCKVDKKAKIGTGSNCIGMKMGKYSYTGKNCSIVNAEIGNYCSIASYCSIGGGGHDYTQISTSPVFYEGKNVFRTNIANLKQTVSRKVTIGNDVWIGEKVFVKEGITIADGAVIGANAVVTHDVGPYEIWGGVPAKMISKRFDDETILELVESKWWSVNDEIIKTALAKDSNPKEFSRNIKDIS